MYSTADFEAKAMAKLQSPVKEFFEGGGGGPKTAAANTNDFGKCRLLPKVLVDVSRRDMTTTLLNGKVALDCPIGISPICYQRLLHPDGEKAAAKGAQQSGAVFVLSTCASFGMEDVAEAAPDAVKWLQVYVCKDRSLTEASVKRAEKAGFSALVLTVDNPIMGDMILALEREGTFPLDSTLPVIYRNRGQSGLGCSIFDESFSWNDLDWLKSITDLPIILKGVIRPDDAKKAASHGFAAVIVSNHGGNFLNDVSSTIEALPAVVEAVKGTQCEIFMDGGIRRGTDVLKALALGAKMVFMGRPAIWGLASNGSEGVKSVVNLVKKELDCCMALTGCTSIESVDPSIVQIKKY